MEHCYWDTVCQEEIAVIKEKDVFGRYYQDLLLTGERALEERAEEKNLYLPKLGDSVREGLAERLQRATLRCLLSELEWHKKSGKLAGDSSRDQYACYVREFLNKKDYQKELYGVYPDMFQAVLRILGGWVDSITEMLERFERDKRQLEALFGWKMEPEMVEGGGSDPHRGGRTVLLLRFKNQERLVYKPRDIGLDRVYQRFLERLMAQAGVSIPPMHMLEGDGYGWCQYVTQKSCGSLEELRRYYKRNGVLLCLSYVLASEDLHYENLIANGEYPVIVDRETLVGARNGRPEPADGIERISEEGVFRIGLLPLYGWNKKGEGINISAVSGLGGVQAPVHMPSIKNPGTADMQIVYEKPVLKEGKNLAKLNGCFLEPAEFLEEMKEGFEKAYRFILEDKEAVEEFLRELEACQGRYLLEHTQKYLMLYQLSCLPEYMADRDKRRGLLAKGLKRNAGTREGLWQQQCETEELLNDDIPCFSCVLSEKGLKSGNGTVCDEFLRRPLMEGVKRRIRRMDEQDLGRQKQFMELSMNFGRKNNPAKAPWLDVVLGEASVKEQCKEIAGAIFRKLERSAIITEKEEIGWISLLMSGVEENCQHIRSLGMYLYDGIAGVAVFAAAFQKMEGGKHCRIGELLKRKLFSYTESMEREQRGKRIPTGLFNGEGSILYTYELLYKITGEREYLDYAERHGRILRSLTERDIGFDLLSGNAGAIVAFLRLYQLTQNREWIRAAQKAAKVLLEGRAEQEAGCGWLVPGADRALAGVSHGCAGIMYALLMLYRETGEKSYLDVAKEAMEYEDSLFQEDTKDWLDLREPESIQKGLKLPPAWCHGKAGILYLRKRMADMAEGEMRRRLEESIARAEEKEAFAFRSEFCLCHGNIGNSILKGDQEAFSRAVNCLYNGRDQWDSVLPLKECENPGFMNGLAGMGYYCLRQCMELPDLLEGGL